MTPSLAEAVELARSYMDQSGRVCLSASQIGTLVRAILAAVELLPTEDERSALERLRNGIWVDDECVPELGLDISMLNLSRALAVLDRLLGAK